MREVLTRAYQAETVSTPRTSIDGWIARSECKCLHERDQVRITNVRYWPKADARECQRWCFLKSDLIAYLRSHHSSGPQATASPAADAEYRKLLGLGKPDA